MTILKRGLAGVAVLVLLPFAGPGHAQIPDEFTNLKLLRKDIGKRELVSIMRDFATALGTRCNHCHVGEDTNSLEGYDFASDEKEDKKVARAMMEMMREINTVLLPATKREELTAVRCVTCHRGLENPETLDRIVLAKAEEDGIEAAIDRYRELRDKYQGQGAYDFSATTLSSVAETLARTRQDVDGAIAISKLNLEFNPEEPFAHLLLGQLYMTKGDQPAAIASIERCLELDPENRWAKQMLEKARASE